jgi:hypothetical protein
MTTMNSEPCNDDMTTLWQAYGDGGPLYLPKIPSSAIIGT